MTTACMAALCAALTIVDGDTLRIGDLPVRIMGIDAVERGEAGYDAATRAMQQLVAGQSVVCEGLYQDRYGRTVAQCWLPDGRDLACAMVGTGHAEDWPRYSKGAYKNC